jgi:dolichol-phosphate mannosyltransferase
LSDKIFQTDARVRLLLRKKERGRGKAEIAGLLNALELKADCVTEMDGDFSHHPSVSL